MRESSRGIFVSNFRHVSSFISRAERALRTAPPTLPLSMTRHVYAAFSRISDPIKSCVLLVDSFAMNPCDRNAFAVEGFRSRRDNSRLR